LERRLVAILAADVSGYTALMDADEAGTLRRLTELRQDFLKPLIDEHHGRIVKLMGDGLLVEFASVVDAVTCLAEPGGICLSDDTYRQVRGKIEASFEDLGGRHLRNVAEPVRVYRVASDSSGAANAASARKTCRCPTNPQSLYCPSPTCQVTPSKNFLPTASPAPTLA
jgi:adenylate cyclase